MSTTTSRTAVSTARPAAPLPGSRLATAGLFALAAMLPFSASPAAATPAAVHQVIAAARLQTDAITAELGRAQHDAAALTTVLRAEVTEAVESASAAAEQARAALAAASSATSSDVGAGAISDEDRASVELADAQVALEAASAHLRHVTSLITDSGSSVPASLQDLAAHVDELRGETAR
ncbi:hypothetical protein SAMN04489860_0541 [Paraoerskovia marina]|uniref:Uncharacterized protein n=2 Tax=Paraoerskovia marina TaxID=545619 RepID=A0A1H1NI92_9CELL|nr:hypothetical protein SAMN04489860_0541 [Paraoerskovia marina]